MVVKSNHLMLFPVFAVLGVGKPILAEDPSLPWWFWLYAVIILFLLAIVFPWLLSRGKKKPTPSAVSQPKPYEKVIKGEAAAAPIVAEKQIPVVTPVVNAAPPVPVVPTPVTPVKPDDLTVLEGIGPKISSVLQSAGIHTYKQLSETGLDVLKDILSKAGIKLADPSTWAEQAKLAAEGKWDDFKTLTGQLKGGRRV